MKRSRLAALLMLLLALVCFLSIPVVAELPWDADTDGGGNGGGNSGDGTDADTTTNDGVEEPEASSGGDGLPSWLTYLMSRYSYPLVFYHLVGSGLSTGYSHGSRWTADGGSTIGKQESSR
ncbi:MAG: hypothetical protein AB1744_04215 [Candidatus Zixiibacteriota bacterium]